MASSLGDEDIQNENGSSSGGKQYNPLVNKPTLVYHADWSSHAAYRWCAMATLASDERYFASALDPVDDPPTTLMEDLRRAAGESGIVFAGFDFPIGVPAHFAKRAKM
jgi:hypothetical protein